MKDMALVRVVWANWSLRVTPSKIKGKHTDKLSTMQSFFQNCNEFEKKNELEKLTWPPIDKPLTPNGPNPFRSKK